MSKFIIKNRGEGKTTDLINISAETNDVIICKDKWRCKLVQDIAKKMGKTIPCPMPIKEIIHTPSETSFLFEQCRKGSSGLLFDDVDDVLEELIGLKCIAITGSPDKE